MNLHPPPLDRGTAGIDQALDRLKSVTERLERSIDRVVQEKKEGGNDDEGHGTHRAGSR